MTILYSVVAVCLIASFLADRKRTLRALRIALRRFLKISPAFAIMLMLVSLTLLLFPEESIVNALSSGGIWIATGVGTLIGSITLMPGFIAFPLCGILRDYGVAFMVLSGFTTTLMMVGILSFPVERTYMGTRVAVIRNIVSFLIAVLVAIATGIVFGEVF